MEVEILQSEYDAVTKEIKSLEDKKSEIIKRAQDNGFAVFDGKIKEDKKVFGVFYDFGFYSHFDGHLSKTVDFYESGANQISETIFNELKKLVQEYKETGAHEKERLYNLIDINDLGAPENFTDARNFWAHFTVCEDDRIVWVYKGSEDDCELHNDSTIEFRACNESEIRNTKTVDTRYD